MFIRSIQQTCSHVSLLIQTCPQIHSHTEHIHTCSFYKQKPTHTFSHAHGHPHLNMITHSNANTFNHAHILMKSYMCILLHMICTNHMSSLMPIFTYTCTNIFAFSHTHVPAVTLEYAYKFTKTNSCSYAYIHTFTNTNILNSHTHVNTHILRPPMHTFTQSHNSHKRHTHISHEHIPLFTHISTHLKVKEESEKAGLKLNIQKTKIMASGLITSWQIDGETMETVTDFIFLGFKITADGDCSCEIQRRRLLGRKAMTNLGSVLKGRDITFLRKVCMVKAMIFPVAVYGCESWTIKKAEHRRIDTHKL